MFLKLDRRAGVCTSMQYKSGYNNNLDKTNWYMVLCSRNNARNVLLTKRRNDQQSRSWRQPKVNVYFTTNLSYIFIGRTILLLQYNATSCYTTTTITAHHHHHTLKHHTPSPPPPSSRLVPFNKLRLWFPVHLWWGDGGGKVVVRVVRWLWWWWRMQISMYIDICLYILLIIIRSIDNCVLLMPFSSDFVY